MTEEQIKQLAIEKYGNDINSFGQQRDGYLEGYKAAMGLWKEKADKWDQLCDDIGKCYYNEDGSEVTDPDIDLCTIGEIACEATRWAI